MIDFAYLNSLVHRIMLTQYFSNVLFKVFYC